MADCIPWFAATYQPLLASGAGNAVLSSGCPVNSSGNAPCAPDDMRRNAEALLASKGFPMALSLEAYTLARYMQSEIGGASIEARVAVGEAARNRAKMEKLSQGVISLLLLRQAVGHPNRGYYGPIHGIGTGTSTAPYGRWAATSQDPTVLTTILAILVMDGQTDNFARNADDQAGPQAWIPQGQAAVTAWVNSLAAKGKYWVGPLVGVDQWQTFLVTTPSFWETAIVSKDALLARGVAALQLPAVRPAWPSDLPVCSRPASTASLIVTTGLAIASGMLAFKHFGHKL